MKKKDRTTSHLFFIRVWQGICFYILRGRNEGGSENIK